MTRKAMTPLRRAPNAGEAEAISAGRIRTVARPVRPDPIASVDGGVFSVAAPHDDDQGGAYQLMDSLGTASNAFTSKSLMQIANTAGATSDDVGHTLAIIAAVAPANELESALAQQMAVTHSVAMSMAQKVQCADTIATLNAYGNLATKFARTFTAQIDALTKLRNGGEQVVRHIHVHPGGQAVVADEFHHHTHGGHNAFIAGQPHAPSAALLGEDASGNGVPIACDQRKEAVPDARRQKPRRASRK